ncbi:MAG: hypothetical protein Q8O13_00120 [Candidatus Omnitrophota bacterium]|nr:hypothetical protein [Candidatus Omnitrophota bacterium]
MCGIGTKWKQPFYDDVEPIKLKEPLAEFLGAIDEGEEFIFTYTDAIKLAGHSCPAVSGAYKITQKALKALYNNEIPMRGEIGVKVLGSVDNGANGPISQVISLITGAAPQTGFAGLGDKFVRRKKLIFDEKNEEPNAFVFTRIDNNKSVKITYHPEKIPSEVDVSEYKEKLLDPDFSYAYFKDENFDQKSPYKEVPQCWESPKWWLQRPQCIGI